MELKKVHRLFEAQAKMRAEEIAVCDAYGNWTYNELDLASERLANFLSYSGVAAKETVLIQATRSSTLIVSLLAVMKAGGRFLILDSNYPQAYYNKIVNIVKPAVSLSLVKRGAGSLDDVFQNTETGVSIFLCENEKDKFVNSIPLRGNFKKHHCVDELYLALTSGSSGYPKIVMGDHRPVSHFLKNYAIEFQLESSDIFCMLSGLGHDPLLRDIFAPLSLGATLSIPDVDHQSSPDRLASWLKSEKVSVIHATPELVRYLLRNSSDIILPDIRYVFIGGDMLNWDLLDSLRNLAPNADLVNAYGATETPQIASYFLIRSGSRDDRGGRRSSNYGVPIGQGLGGFDLLLLNEEGVKCRTNEVGEIFVVSAHLARGYFNDAVATDSSFLELCIDGRKCRSFRTGDVGRMNGDGYVEYVARKDHQIKIGSRRIPLMEIETTLQSFTEIQQVKVLCVNKTQGEQKNLVAFFIPNKGIEIDEINLKAKLLNILPHYMCPSKFSSLEKFPLLTSGKVDLSKLEVMGLELCKLIDNEKSLTSLESRLCELWSVVLGLRIDSKDATKNFFEIGGNSLLAIELVNVLNQEFQIQLSITNIFTYSSIREIAHYLEVGLDKNNRSDIPKLATEHRHRFIVNRSSLEELSASE